MNNIADMSIIEQLEVAKAGVCKHLEKSKNGKLSERTLEEICRECPLGRI